MSSHSISLTISIVSYREPAEQLVCAVESIQRALSALLAAGGDCRCSVILVDNSESAELRLEWLDALRPALDGLGCALHLIQGHGNVGYGSGQNLALAASDAAYHLFMNPDVELAPDSLSCGLAYLQDNPQVGMVSPFAVDGAGRKQHLCKRYPTVFDFFLRGFAPRWVQSRFDARLARYEMRELSELSGLCEPNESGEPEPVTGIPIISGCCMLCRRDVLDRVNGFDPGYFLYFEDFDLSLRVGELASLAYVPGMRIRHLGGGSARKGVRHIVMFVRSARRFFATHGWRWVTQQREQ